MKKLIVLSVLFLNLIILSGCSDMDMGSKIQEIECFLQNDEYSEAIKVYKKLNLETKELGLELFKEECENIKLQYINGEINRTESSIILNIFKKNTDIKEIALATQEEITIMAEAELEKLLGNNHDNSNRDRVIGFKNAVGIFILM